MRSPTWMLSMTIAFVAASAAARAQFPGAPNPWQPGRPGIPGVPPSTWPPGRIDGFNPFGQRPGIPGLPGPSLPWTRAGRDPFATPIMPGVPRIFPGGDLANDPRNRPPAANQPRDRVNVRHLPPEVLSHLLKTDLPKIELPKYDPPFFSKGLPGGKPSAPVHREKVRWDMLLAIGAIGAVILVAAAAAGFYKARRQG